MCAARSRRVVSLMVPIAALVCASAVPALPQTVPGAAIVKIHNEKVHVVGQTLAPGQAERRSGDRPGIVLFLDAGTAAVTAAGGDARTRIVQRGDGIYDPRLAGTVRNVGGSSLRLLRISPRPDLYGPVPEERFRAEIVVDLGRPEALPPKAKPGRPTRSDDIWWWWALVENLARP